ncbi:AAA family ATPase [Rhizobium laguerreae]|uniref:AAA family ATPase n=1 Tax=Rhizobium laguerreae TaxID=1076926 RepID=UPI001C904C90|nr:AAA family ATPase [Rhizobium laguerreae]MBY3151221.1 AAA family ATPase [Rhizobium laguerreae]
MDVLAEQRMRRELDDSTRRVALARGEFNALTSRKAELESSVGYAKGRLDKKKDVEQFIEDLQSDIYRKRVADLEKLLSALVYEVIETAKPIGLELEIERGLPSLDIVSRISADLSEDIFEDEGGAKTNVVVLGLRLLAIVCSRMRRFVVLDEADCWIKDDRVSKFYSVIKDAGRKLGMQCFAISHHNMNKFAEGISVSSVSGHPEAAEGVRIENNPKAHKWADDEEGFRYIRLVNFQGYIDETLRLHPGVNALIGDNNIGKSCFVRALRAVFYGESRDTLIRRGETSCSVEIGLREGYILQWTRHLKRNPTWRLLAPNRAVFSEDYDTTPKSKGVVPDWVLKDIGIGPIAGLDPHIIKQKEPIFLLNKTGSVRASVLSIGQESGHIREMVGTYKKMCEEDNLTVKNGEAEMGRIMQREVHLEKVLATESTLDDLKVLIADIERLRAETTKAEALVENIDRISVANVRLREVSGILSRLPGQDELIKLERDVRRSSELAAIVDRLDRTSNDIVENRKRREVLDALPRQLPALTPSDELIRIGKAIKDTIVANEGIRAKIAILCSLPRELPKLEDVGQAEKLLVDIERVTALMAETKRRKESAKVEADRIETEMLELAKELAEELGHSCPTCGGHVEDAAVFVHGAHVHTHHHEAVHV